MILSIIITYYNKNPYTNELLDVLKDQITDDVEVVLIDDGSAVPFETQYSWCRVIRKENGGVSSARNAGIENTTGEYISFIDGDDLVDRFFVRQILSKIPFDFLDMSWRTLPGGDNFFAKLESERDRLSNPSAVTRVWNRAYIGDRRFNEQKDAAEDAEFTRDLISNFKAKRAVITDYMYFYRTKTPNSLTDRFMNGLTETKRIVYYFKTVKPDMRYLIDEILEENKTNEVILMTERCDIPELLPFVDKPHRIRGAERRGEYFPLFVQIACPLRTQVVIWTSKTFNIGGIETFIYYFCQNMRKYYDITVLYDVMDPLQMSRLKEIVEVVKYTSDTNIVCDTLIVNRVNDPLPSGVHAKRTIQMVHGVKMPNYSVPKREIIVSVSNVVKESWDLKESEVIHNMVYVEKPKTKPLLLVSATRLDLANKGGDRMIQLANMMRKQGVDFLWLYFSNEDLRHVPEGMVRVKPTLDIVKYIQMADYLVQLSAEEAFCYSIVEALEVGTPVITTPLDVLDEIGVRDGENGYVVPFDIVTDTTRFLDIPSFDYHYDNKPLVRKWRKLLGNTKPKRTYDPSVSRKVRIKMQYFDIYLNRVLNPGDVVVMPKERVDEVLNANAAELVEE